ncbi:MAG: S8 family peptidase [Ferruginibacter sp.]|nr:S8 family peptidase [Cytophagales bacterium]
MAGFLITVHLAPVSLVVAQLPPSASEDSLRGNPTKKAPANWFNLDRSENQVPGVSTEKAYQLLKDRPSKTVVVAVIDGGVDEEHEDLKSRMWVNEDEVAGNGVDDDKNGYVDDVHGWNFIGGKDGRNVDQDTYEVTREYGRLRKKYEGVVPAKVKKKEQAEYGHFRKVKATVETKVRELQEQTTSFSAFKTVYEEAREVIKSALGKDTLVADEIAALRATDEKTKRAQSVLLYALANDMTEASLKETEEYFDKGLKYGYNLAFDPRGIVGDNPANLKEKYYGNNDVTGPDASHGTHVAGIIAADRTNALGIRGVADNVRIMAVRAVPNGDERDKDVANAIYYAVDNGARIINMSFGKDYSPNKELVDAAVNYATSKGVLLVHAAGNDGENIDTASNFPTVKFGSTSRALKNWIEVGAASWKDSTDLAADFSNYGKNTVDLFAPGVDVHSTMPNQGYKDNSGTSMAAPVTSGVAALLMSYFPNLSAEQIREVLVQSTVKRREVRVNKPGEEEAGQESTIAFGELSKTGGVVNAYEAVRRAEELSGRQLAPAR